MANKIVAGSVKSFRNARAPCLRTLIGYFLGKDGEDNRVRVSANLEGWRDAEEDAGFTPL